MTVPSPRGHDPLTRDAEDTPTPPAEAPAARPWFGPGPITSIYLCLMVTVLLLAVLFDWRL